MKHDKVMTDMNAVATIPRMNREIVEMRRLILDFIMRCPWAIAYGMACAVMVAFSGFAPFALGIFIMGPGMAAREGTAGTVKCLRTLPISQKTLGRTLWLEGVVLFPLFCVVWSPVVLLFSFFDNWRSGMNWRLLFETLLMSVVFMGCCGAAMLLVSSIFSVIRGTGKTRTFLPVLLGGLWLAFCMERIFRKDWSVLGGNNQVDFAVLAGAPVMMALSYIHYAGMTFGGRAQSKKASMAGRPVYSRGGFRPEMQRGLG